MDVTTDIFGTLADGREVMRTRLANSYGMEVSVIDFGAALQRVRTPDARGFVEDIMLGYESLDNYLDNKHYFGVTVGRFANRIARGRFSIDGEEYTLTCNHGKHHLHGGEYGLSRVLWSSEPFLDGDTGGVVLRCVSPHGEEGYPGELAVKVVFSLNENNELLIEYLAESDRITPVNLTNHAYWNLEGPGGGDIKNHHLTMHCSRVLETDDNLIPTGKIMKVDGDFDFHSSRRLGDAMKSYGKGFDHCYVVEGRSVLSDSQLNKVAELVAAGSSRKMEVYTDTPGVQLYTGNFIESEPGLDGVEYRQHAGLCLETQNFPDAVNQTDFPDPFVTANAPYLSRTKYVFSTLL